MPGLKKDEHNMIREFTASVYIVENNHVLLIYHRKLEKWLPPGGHLESNEIPSEAAKREALEETGLEIEFITQENIWLNHWNAVSIERPFMCLLENIPSYGSQPPHQHIDMIYLARPKGGALKLNYTETGGIRWFSLEDLERLSPDIQIFQETMKTAQLVLLTTSSIDIM